MLPEAKEITQLVSVREQALLHNERIWKAMNSACDKNIGFQQRVISEKKFWASKQWLNGSITLKFQSQPLRLSLLCFSNKCDFYPHDSLGIKEMCMRHGIWNYFRGFNDLTLKKIRWCSLETEQYILIFGFETGQGRMLHSFSQLAYKVVFKQTYPSCI